MWSTSSKPRGRRLLLLIAVATLAWGGCRRGEVLGPVTGKVTFQGEPVTEGVMIFSNPKKGVYMTAPLDENGVYEVEMAHGYGLPLGTYQVAISPPEPDVPPVGPIDKPPEIKEYPNIPLRYRRPETSGLELTVERKGNSLDVHMEP